MDDFGMDRQPLADRVRRQTIVMRDQRYRRRIGILTYPPHVKVGDLGITGAGMRSHDLTNLIDHGMMHLPVEEHAARVAHQADCPHRHQDRTCDAHDGIKPRPPEQHAASERRDRQDRRRGIRDDMDICRPEIEVVGMVRVVAVMMRIPVLLAVGVVGSP